jgi:heterodisulfide reductase subunit B
MRDAAFKADVDDLLDAPTPALPGGEGADLPDTFSVLQVFVERIGLDAIRARVTRPLDGVRVAPYYGCLLSRPAEAMQFDDPENPTAMDRILAALGAEVLPFPLKTECCGAAMGIPRKDVTASLGGRILSVARAFGADAVAVACPLCHMNLDLRQNQAGRAAGTKFDLPVLYYTQFMGLAFGLPPDNLRLDKLAVSPKALLAALAERRAGKAEPQTGNGGREAESPAEQGDAS